MPSPADDAPRASSAWPGCRGSVGHLRIDGTDSSAGGRLQELVGAVAAAAIADHVARAGVQRREQRHRPMARVSRMRRSGTRDASSVAADADRLRFSGACGARSLARHRRIGHAACPGRLHADHRARAGRHERLTHPMDRQARATRRDRLRTTLPAFQGFEKLQIAEVMGIAKSSIEHWTCGCRDEPLRAAVGLPPKSSHEPSSVRGRSTSHQRQHPGSAATRSGRPLPPLQLLLSAARVVGVMRMSRRVPTAGGVAAVAILLQALVTVTGPFEWSSGFDCRPGGLESPLAL